MSAVLPAEDMTLYNASFFAKHMDLEHLKAHQRIGVELGEVLKPHSVVDFGCGTGGILAAINAETRHGIEHPSNKEAILKALPPLSVDHYIWADLRNPLWLLRRYDLAICVEVAEHLPKESADVLVTNLVRHSDRVFFSGAYPGQGGAGHINEVPFSFWEALFASKGYTVDHDLTGILVSRYEGDLGGLFWYKRCALFVVQDPMA